MRSVVDIEKLLTQDEKASWIGCLWDRWNNQRQTKIAEWTEVRNYLFATDTTTTSNNKLPWKNSTTLPKLTQIRDNLHANYIEALFPNEWLKYDPANKEAADQGKARTITSYIKNKTDNSHFQLEVSKAIYDWIDKGNSFGRVTFEEKKRFDPILGEEVVDYVGPRLYRISPMDIVFDPTATSFEESPKIIRSIKTLGDLVALADDNKDFVGVDKIVNTRKRILKGGYRKEDFQKAIGFAVDGFGDMYEYFTGQYVELLEFFGDYFNSNTGKLERNKRIVIADRMCVLIDEDQDNFSGNDHIFHIGWRERSDNLWAMGPLDNLVGMQYRIDHLENLKADAMDLIVHPPLGVKGDVDDFTWGPGEKIYLGEEGAVTELGKSLQGVVNANNEIQLLEARMEMYAGAPREAMGIRSPGEKTAFEVSQLMNAAGRIFQEKTNAFQQYFLEPIVNAMLAEAIKNFNGSDFITSTDNSNGVEIFLTITRDDLVSQGRLRPIGARHFAQQALLVQNLNSLMNSSLSQVISPHIDSLLLAQMVENVLDLHQYKIFRPWAALDRQTEGQTRANFLNEELAAQSSVPAV